MTDWWTGSPVVGREKEGDWWKAAPVVSEKPKKKRFVEQRWSDLTAPARAAVGALQDYGERNRFGVTQQQLDAARARGGGKAVKAELDRAQADMRTRQRERYGTPTAPTTLLGKAQQVAGDAINPVRDSLDLAASLFGLVTSPVTGVGDLALRPAARGLERAGVGDEEGNLEVFNTALMGARPVPGAAPVPRAAPRVRPGPEVREFMARTKPDVEAMRARAQDYRDVGLNPSLVNVTDESGRALVRASASRPTPARQAVTDVRDAAALDLPNKIGAQARRVISRDARTPDEIREALAAERTRKGNEAFGAAREEVVELPPEALETFQVPAVARAVREAALRERNPETRQRLLDLGKWARESGSIEQAPALSVGMTDRISRVLLSGAEKAARAGDKDLAATFRMYGEGIREPTRQASPGYAGALEQWSADSRLLNAVDVGENFMARNTDEFAAGLSQMNPEEQLLARAAARRAIERKAGENVSAAPGVARTIATAPEQMARNRALLGESAEDLQRGMGLAERQVRDLTDIAPRSGSQTQLRDQDAAAAARGVLQTGQQIFRGDWMGLVMDRLRSVGIRDDVAQAIAEMAIDPNRLDETLLAIERAAGPTQAQAILQSLADPLVAAGSVSASRYPAEP